MPFSPLSISPRSPQTCAQPMRRGFDDWWLVWREWWSDGSGCQCCIEDEGGPLGVCVQKQAPNCGSAAVAQKVTVVNDCRKVGHLGRQVRVEKVSESKPTEDASKVLDAVETVGVATPREKLGEWSADRPSGSRCKGGTSSTQASIRNTRRADWRCVGKRQVVEPTRRNTDASVSGGAAGSSDEGPVTGLERSCSVVRWMTSANSATRKSL